MKAKKENAEQLILGFIESYQGEHKRPPTVREIQKEMGYKSPRAVSYFLDKLEKARLIMRKARSRGIFLTGDSEEKPPEKLEQIPLFENIPAGYGEPGEACEADEMIPVHAERLFGIRAGRGFAVKVRGESMKGAAILDGDIVVLDRREPEVGDIVAALIDGETTLKRLVKEGRKYFLKAENPDYPDLYPAESLMVQGVVAGVIRRAFSHAKGLREA